MTTHTLKCWPAFYDAVAAGDKTFELRLDDRGFQKGDMLELCRTKEDVLDEIQMMRTEEGVASAPAHMLRRRITYCLHGPKFGLAPGYAIMALEKEE